MKNRNPVARLFLGSSLTIALCLMLAVCGSPTGPTPPAVPGTPENVRIDPVGDDSALRWDSVDTADDYLVYFSSDDNAYSPYSTVVIEEYFLPKYGYYKVSARNSEGESSLSEAVLHEASLTQLTVPTFSPPASVEFEETQNVTITSPDGGTIYYTLDGTTPRIGISPEYVTPITVTSGQTFTITAIAHELGKSNSDAAVGTFHVKGWEVVGNAGFSEGAVLYGVSLGQGSDGTIYIAYRDESSTKAIVKYFDGSSWNRLGGVEISSGAAFYVTMALDSSDNIYVAYYDLSQGGKATVRRFLHGGTSWTTVGSAGFTPSTALFVDIAINSSGVPYIVYQDAADDPLYRADVRYWNGTTWTPLASSRPSEGMISGASFKISRTGIPYFAFIDESATSYATVSRFAGGVWSYVGGSKGLSPGTVSSISLSLNYDETPILAYKDNSTTPAGKATVMDFDGSGWDFLGTEGITPEKADLIALSIDSGENKTSTNDDSIYIAYKDNSTTPVGKPSVMKYSGASWTQIGSAGLWEGTVTGCIDMLVDDQGIPYIAFADGSSSGKITVLAYR